MGIRPSCCIYVNIIAIDNSGVNILLVSASVEGVSHTYSHLYWLTKAYCVYMGVRLRCPLRRTAYLLYFCHHIYEGLTRKGLCTWSFLQVAASKCLKTAEIAFIPCIFLPTEEVRYTPCSRLFSHLEPGANGLNAHAGIIYIEYSNQCVPISAGILLCSQRGSSIHLTALLLASSLTNVSSKTFISS